MKNFDIPTPDEVFKQNEVPDERQVEWFVEKIVLAIKDAGKTGDRYRPISFTMPEEFVSYQTKLKLIDIFAEEGWDIIWSKPNPIIIVQ
jgi:hypothetical protein